jgi:hypothetical protein
MKTQKHFKNNIKKNTLDEKHKEITDTFYNEDNYIIPKLYFERKLLYSEYEDCNIDEKINIKFLIENIDKTIKLKKKNKKNYFLNNSEIIFNYFENKKKISEEINNNINNTIYIEKFFKINNNNNNEIQKKSITDIDRYFKNINSENINLQQYLFQSEKCQSCNNGELIPLDNEGILICNKCFNCTKYLSDNEKPTYKEPPKEVCFYAYKRINHFREILAQFQAKETTLIPDEVIENIKLQIKKERLNILLISNKRLKDVLKKLKYNKYYEHIPFIKDKLGIKPPIMSPELEETLCNLFMDIQVPYAKFCPDDRVNFLNYYYTIYKLCELLQQNQFLSYFPMLKDREKRIEQDDIWKKICKELNWRFIPTI